MNAGQKLSGILRESTVPLAISQASSSRDSSIPESWAVLHHQRYPLSPSHSLHLKLTTTQVLSTWNTREGELIAANKLDRIVAQPPNSTNVHAGAASEDIKTKVGKEGARTIPGRPEHGGNCDIKNLSRGSKVFLPVHVPGAKFSVGDLHFSQGDGEISFCGAIEMAGVVTINFKVMKNGVRDLGMKSPIYLPGPVEPHYGPGRYLTFEGFSVDEHGKQVCYLQTSNPNTLNGMA